MGLESSKDIVRRVVRGTAKFLMPVPITEAQEQPSMERADIVFLLAEFAALAGHSGGLLVSDIHKLLNPEQPKK